MIIVHEFTGVLSPIQTKKLVGTLTDFEGVLSGSLNSTQGKISGNLMPSEPYLLNGTLTLPPEADSVYYEGEYIVTPKPFDETVLDTGGLKMYRDVTISVESNKNITPAITSQTITPDTGYDYLAQVTVAAIPYTETPNTYGTTVTIG